MPNGEADPAPQVAGDSTVGDDLRKLIQGEKQTAEPQAIGTDLRALVQGKAEPDQYGFLNIDTIMGGGAQEQDAPSDDSAAPAPSPEPEQYGFLDIGMVSGGESTTPSMADHEAAAKKQGQRIEPMGNLLSNHLPTGAKAVMTPEAWETRRRMMKALTDIGIDPVESSTNYIPLLGGFELTDGQYNERLMAQFKEAFRLPDTASITQLQEIEDRIAMSQAHSIINLYRQDMAENPDDPFHAHDLILAPYAPMPLDPDDPEKGLVYPDLPDAEQSRAFMEAINARRELGDQDTHVFIAALYDRALRGLTFDKIGVGNALEAAESVFGDGMTAEDAEMFQRMMAKAVDERGFAGALAAEGANFLPALIPIGKLAGGVRAGAMKAGMSAAAAQKLATPLSLGLYGGIAAEGDVEDRLKAAGTSAAFGIVSPAIANRVSDALRRFPSFIQHGAAEAIGFMGASAAVHGGEVSGQQALMDGILGGFLGVLSNRSGRVAKGNARDATRNVRDAAERAEVARRATDPATIEATGEVNAAREAQTQDVVRGTSERAAEGEVAVGAWPRAEGGDLTGEAVPRREARERTRHVRTQPVADALGEYRNSAHSRMNEALRGEGSPEYRERAEQVRKAVDEAPPLPEPRIHYRGIKASQLEAMGGRDQFLANLERAASEGGEIRLPGLQSTSTVPGVAMRFTDADAPIMFEILSDRGLPVDRFGAARGESEVVLGHDWAYRVERVERGKNATVVSLRHVPEPAKAQDATVRGEPQRQAQEAIEVAEATEPAIKPIEGTASEKIDLDGLARDIEAFSGTESPDATRPLPRQAGAVDITEVPKLPWKLARKITGKTRDAVEAINRVGNNLVRLSFTGNAEAVKFLAGQAGRIPGVSGLVQRGRAAAEAAKLRLDGLQTGRVFNDALAEMEYGKDLAALQSDATVHTFAKVPTGERGILGRKKYRAANDFEMANVNAFLEGQVTAEQMRDRGIHEDLIREAERGRKLRLDNHEALHKAGLISDESYRSYKEVGPTRTDYSEFLEAELADPGSGGLKVPKNELKRDAAVTVTWKDGGRKRHRKFFARDHGGSRVAAMNAAERFYNELKSASESGDRNRARKVLGDDAVEVEMTDLGRRLTGTKGRITDVESLPQERRGDKIEHPAFRHSRTLMLQEAMLGRRRMQQRLAADPSQVRSGKKVRQPDGSFKWEPPDDLPENFNPVPIPDDPRYGPLAGKFVRQGIRGEIEGQFGPRNGAGWAALKAIDAATSQWKIGKTIANPATHARNMMGNVFFAELAGLSFMRPEDTQHFLDAMKVLRARKATDPGFNLMAALTKMGVGRNNGISNEAGALMDYITRLEGRSMKSRWEQMWADARKGRLFEAMGGKGFDLARAAYEFEDVVYKVAYALQQLRKGKTLAEAGRLTNRYFPNYNQNPAARAMQGRSLGKHLARASFLPPFLSFTAEAMRIMSVHSVERPFSLAMGTTLLSGITKAAMESLGLTDEDMKRLRENGPSWSVPGSAVVPLLPWVDSDGKLRVIDTQFINPGAEFFLAMEALTQGKKAPALGGRGETGAYLDFINNPVLAPVQDLFRNQSRFFGSDIVPEGLDDPAMRWEHRLKYLLESWAPSFTPGVGRSFQRLKEGVTGETIKKGSGAPNRHGDTRGLFEAVADTIGGLRTRPINPTREQQEALRSVGFRMMAKKRALRSALRRGDEAEADQIRQEMRELAAEAERMGQPLSENLLRFDPEAEK